MLIKPIMGIIRAIICPLQADIEISFKVNKLKKAEVFPNSV